MTFSVAGFCRETGQFGTAISSSSICVGARCAFVAPRHGAVLSQNVTNPALGHLGVRLLEDGLKADDILERLVAQEAHPAWRQLLVLDGSGHGAAHSGAETLGTYATHIGRDCVIGGNMLADSQVPMAMAEAFESADGELAERLLLAMEAGLRAGGEMGPVHSAGLLVADQVSWPVVDLRVDWHDMPLTELRSLWNDYRPQRDDYIRRASQPDDAPGYGVPGDNR